MLVLEQLNCYYDKVHVLKDVSLRLAPGEILLTLGVATCMDVQRDALSLDDSFITTMIETGGHANLRVVRDRRESLWPRVLVHSASGFRRGTPSVIIVDRKGMVFTTSFAATRKHRRRSLRALQAALALAAAPDRGAHHPRVQPAASAYSKDHLGEAAGMAERLLDDDDPDVISSAAQLLGLIQIRYDAEVSRVEGMVEEGRVNSALGALEELRRDFGGHELSDEVRLRRETLLEDPALQEERKADRALSRLEAELERRDLSGKATRRLLAGRLRRLAKRYEGTRSATRASTRAEELDPTFDGE